jgi:hypothetical protein
MHEGMDFTGKTRHGFATGDGVVTENNGQVMEIIL